ncbi:MAG: hypothetical protein J2P31_12955 [Blastocatellia bacterium]|nr:hypothetical protein [Blastocatellia bacterium]
MNSSANFAAGHALAPSPHAHLLPSLARKVPYESFFCGPTLQTILPTLSQSAIIEAAITRRLDQQIRQGQRLSL